MTYSVDLNCDMGESFGNYVLGNDGELMDYISSANIACGFHAGDPVVMARTVKLAAEKGVAIGAHPSYPDLQGFGRRRLDMTPDEIEAALLYQIGALDAFARANGTRLAHVKGHGAVYNVAAVEPPVAQAYANAVRSFNPELPIFCLASSPMMIEVAEKTGLRVIREAFADRAYNADGSLVSRRLPGSLITDPEKSAEQVIRMVKEGKVIALDGQTVPLRADTICIHGDGSNATAIVRYLRERLAAEGIEVKTPDAARTAAV